MAASFGGPCISHRSVVPSRRHTCAVEGLECLRDKNARLRRRLANLTKLVADMAGDHQRHGALSLVDNPAGSDIILEEEVEFLPPVVCGEVPQSVEDALGFDDKEVHPDSEPIFDDYEVLGDPIFDYYGDDDGESQESEPIFEFDGDPIYDVYSKGGEEAMPLFIKLAGEFDDFTMMEPSVVRIAKPTATTNMEENHENPSFEWQVEEDSFLDSSASVRLKRDFQNLLKKEKHILVGWLIYDPGKLESLLVQYFSYYCGGFFNDKMIDDEYYARDDSRDIFFYLGEVLSLAIINFAQPAVNSTKKLSSEKGANDTKIVDIVENAKMSILERTKHFQKMVFMLQEVLEEESCVISSRSLKTTCVAFGNRSKVAEKVVVLDDMLMKLVVKICFDGQRLQKCEEHKEFGILRHGYFASLFLQDVGPTEFDSKIERRYKDIGSLDLAMKPSTVVDFDERMLLQLEVAMKSHPRLDGLNCLRVIAARKITKELHMIYSGEHVESVELTSHLISSYFTPNTYVNEHSAHTARLAAGLCADLASAIFSGHAKNGFAHVRLLGHHVGVRQAMGFCLHNNAALAAQVAGAKKVLIVDWDVQHGNETQEIYKLNKSILYISLHRHEGGKLYLGTGVKLQVGGIKDDGVAIYNLRKVMD